MAGGGTFMLCLILCLASNRAAAQNQPSAGVPTIIHECEGNLCSNWTWNDLKFRAQWSNGAVATLTVESFTTSSVVIDRTDAPNSSTAGLTAVYTGEISNAGNSIVNGKVTWTWRGFKNGVAKGAWTGTWTPTACTIAATTLAHVPGTDDSKRALTGRIGVGENVKLTLTNGDAATWTITSGGGPLTPDVTAATGFLPGEGFPTEQCSGSQSSEVSGTQACFIAPDKSDSTIVKATLANGESCSTKFKTAQPEGIVFQRLQTPKDSPDYAFSKTALVPLFKVTMESVAFVTPGDVSFANVIFEERDTEPPHFDRRFNALFNIAGTNAWLLGCDYDLDTGDPFASNSSDSPFDFAVFANGALETQLEFSHVQTVWSITSGTVTFSKRQIEALSAAGTFVGKPVPDPQASILKEPAVNFNDFKPLPDDKGKTCLADVTAQFHLVPSP